MRIAILTWSSRLVGGAERYLSIAIPELRARGHHVALCHELDDPVDRERLPEAEKIWCVAELGRDRAIEELRRWRPDVIYTHLVNDPVLEGEAQKLAPAVLLTHGYQGACISGTRSFSFPEVVPCGRRFGPACLLRYYPRRCGGLSPTTMIQDYRKQDARKNLLSGYSAIIANSTHVAEEYAHYVKDSRLIQHIALPVVEPPAPASSGCSLSAGSTGERDAWRILFVGRMDRLKGGLLLLEAARIAASALEHPLEITLAGEGPARRKWQHAGEALEHSSGVSVRFTGWLTGAALDAEWNRTDLLAVPSLWPEPFGLVGIEAASRGIPAVAFAVGGIPDWLHDGRTGALAPASPPTAGGLADAITRCLADEESYRRLSRGALESGKTYTRSRHFDALEAALQTAIRDRKDETSTC